MEKRHCAGFALILLFGRRMSVQHGKRCFGGEIEEKGTSPRTTGRSYSAWKTVFGTREIDMELNQFCKKEEKEKR